MEKLLIAPQICQKHMKVAYISVALLHNMKQCCGISIKPIWSTWQIGLIPICWSQKPIKNLLLKINQIKVPTFLGLALCQNLARLITKWWSISFLEWSLTPWKWETLALNEFYTLFWKCIQKRAHPQAWGCFSNTIPRDPMVGLQCN
jgi:hypothetical protein